MSHINLFLFNYNNLEILQIKTIQTEHKNACTIYDKNYYKYINLNYQKHTSNTRLSNKSNFDDLISRLFLLILMFENFA